MADAPRQLCREGPHLAAVAGAQVHAAAGLRLLAKAGVEARAVHAAAASEVGVCQVSLFVAQLQGGNRQLVSESACLPLQD